MSLTVNTKKDKAVRGPLAAAAAVGAAPMRGAAYVVSCSRRRRRALGFSFDGLSRRRFPPPPAELWAFLSKAAAAGGCFSFEGRPMSPAAAAAAQILVKLPKEPPNHLDEFLQLDKDVSLGALFVLK